MTLAGVLLFVPALSVFAGVGDSTRITKIVPSVTSSNRDPQISGGLVVWEGINTTTGSADIYSYNNGSQLNISNHGDYISYPPQISGTNFVWAGGGGGDDDIYFYNGGSVTNLSNNYGGDDSEPQIDGTNVVWRGNSSGNWDIYLHDGTGVTNLSDDSGFNQTPQIDGTNVVWRGNADGNYDIYLHDGVSVTNLSDNSANNYGARISGTNVVWRSDANGNNDIYLYDGTSVTNLSDNTIPGAESPNNTMTQISGTNVVWSSNADGDYDIYLYDGTGVTNLSNDYGGDDFDPQIDGTNVVWRGNTGGDDEIYFYDGTSVSMLSNNTGDDRLPQISGNNVVWQGPETWYFDPIADVYVSWWIGPGADLSHIDLRGEDLSDLDLTAADLTEANLSGADFSGTILTGTNFNNALLPSALPSLPVINGANVRVQGALAVSGLVHVDTDGLLSVTSDSFTATGVNMQGGNITAAWHGLDLDEIGDISGHGRLFGDVDLGTSGTIAGSGAGLELFGHVSGTGTITGTTIFGNVSPGNSAGQLGLTDVVLSSAGTLNLEIGGTDTQQYDQVTLAGTMSLAGDLQVQLIDSFVPQVGDIFSLFNLAPSTNLLGGFSDILLPELASGVWDATGLLSSGNLLVISPGPNPCGLGGDSGCSTADLDALYGVFNTNVPPTDAVFDLNSDNVVDAADLNEWLSLAATENGHSSAYLRGDTDLDRNVDLADYSALATNFDPTGSLGSHGWGHGNSDGDNDVDLADYNVLASNFSPAGYGAAAVPEPTSLCLLLTALLVLARVRF
jgi:beta propeller repeat protein